MPSFPEFISGKGILSSGKGILSSDQSYFLRNACVLRCWPRARMKRINPGRSWSSLLLKKRLCFKLLPPAPGWRAQILVLLGRNFFKKKRVCVLKWCPPRQESSANGVGIECKWSGNREEWESLRLIPTMTCRTFFGIRPIWIGYDIGRHYHCNRTCEVRDYIFVWLDMG